MIQSTRLSYVYPGSTQVLAFPDLEIAQGSVALLSGPSGSGKSTWMALVAGLINATTGTLVVAGQPVGSLSKAQSDAWRARTIGFLPQKLHLTHALSVEDNLRMAQWAAGAAQNHTAIHKALAALGIAELAKRKPSELSGGQAQRAALARAVLMQPRVILADEPTASLDDAAAQGAVALLLSTAKSQGATLVIATHDHRVAQYIALANPGAAMCTVHLPGLLATGAIA